MLVILQNRQPPIYVSVHTYVVQQSIKPINISYHTQCQRPMYVYLFLTSTTVYISL